MDRAVEDILHAGLLAFHRERRDLNGARLVGVVLGDSVNQPATLGVRHSARVLSELGAIGVARERQLLLVVEPLPFRNTCVDQRLDVIQGPCRR